jgi:hypothetical protein
MYKVDEWVRYHQFPAADSEWLRKGKKAVILEVLGEGKYRIYVDEPELDIKWRVKIVKEENLKAVN